MFGNAPPASQPVYQRHALGLPAGSVRAILALGILGLLWLFVLQYNDEKQKLPLEFIYLEYLMLLILASYFTAHGKTIGTQVSTRSPLGLPSGAVRVLLMAGYLGLAAYMWYNHSYEFDQPVTGPPVLLILLLLSSFFLGHILTGIVRWISGPVLPAPYQDIQAWLAMLALFLMAGLAMYHLFIRPTLSTPYDVPIPVEATLAAIVGFYFGARS
jgi:hypothetical protein